MRSKDHTLKLYGACTLSLFVCVQMHCKYWYRIIAYCNIYVGPTVCKIDDKNVHHEQILFVIGCLLFIQHQYSCAAFVFYARFVRTNPHRTSLIHIEHTFLLSKNVYIMIIIWFCIRYNLSAPVFCCLNLKINWHLSSRHSRNSLQFYKSCTSLLNYWHNFSGQRGRYTTTASLFDIKVR